MHSSTREIHSFNRTSWRDTLQQSPGLCMLLSGLALGFSFPPFPSYMLAWVALVPMLLRWMHVDSARRLYLEAYGMWSIASAVAFSWPLLHPFPITALASLGGLLALCMIGAVPIALSVPVRRQGGLLVGLGALLAFTLSTEWIMRHGPLAFPWMLFGHTQAEAFPFNQIAALGGTAALSCWVLLLNGVILLLAVGIRRRLMIGWLALLIAGPALYGAARLHTAPPSTDAKTPALLVQPALPPSQWANVHDERRVHELMALTDSALHHRPATEEPPLVIWPETALPPHLTVRPPSGDSPRLQRWIEQRDIALLTGAIRHAGAARDSAFFYNSAVRFRPTHPPQIYNKNRLVPFAERVPLVDMLPELQVLSVPAGGVAGYATGTDQPLLTGPGFVAGALICFESTFPALARRYVHRSPSANFLVTLAQDGWWGPTLGYRQHFAFTRLRAIETGRTVAMVTVTGTSGVIQPSGRAIQQTNWMQRTARWTILPHYRTQTVFLHWGDILSHGALGLTVCLVLGLAWVRARPLIHNPDSSPRS